VEVALKAILSDPHGSNPLRHELEGLKRFKVGWFRIICRKPSRDTIDIVAIGPRKDICEETYRLVRKKPVASSQR
jgi:mRNA-degrading endonuclease RelE of RelBE toxin-antitoxin system